MKVNNIKILNLFKKKQDTVCSCCGESYDDFSVAYNEPNYDLHLDNKMSMKGEDFCIMDGEYYFIRCILEIPIINHTHPFTWGVWVSQSKTNFEIYKDNFKKDTKDRHTFGYLSNELNEYSGSQGLHAQVCFQNDGNRPKVILEEAENQLYTFNSFER